MKRSLLLRTVLIIAIIALVGSAIVANRDYQDSWILEGLEIPFIVFILTYVTYCFVEDKLSWTIVFALVARCVFLLIPNLKYTWFQGVNFDQHYHFRIIQDICDKGYVPVGLSYSGTPSMHLLFSVFSITTGSPVLFAFKYLPVMCWLFFPLIVYSVVRLAAPGKPSLLKYAVLISSIPVRLTLSTVLVGVTFGTLLVILFFSQFVRAFQVNARNSALVAMVFAFVLASAHSYSATMLAGGLLMTYMASRSEFVKGRLKMLKFGRSYTGFLLLLIVLDAAWLVFSASVFFLNATQMMEQWMNAILGATPSSARAFTDINLSFFGLSFASQLRIVTVFYGGILLMLLMTLLGILCARRILRTSKILNFASAVLLSMWLVFAVQIILSGARAGLFEYGRLFDFSYVFAPVFVGVLLYYLQERLHSAKLNFVLCLLLVTFATIEVYGFQPLLPLSVIPNVPSDQYAIYIGQVNSIYQRSMIMHTAKYVRTGIIACDRLTEVQILGLTGFNFSQTHILGKYPFDRMANLTQEKFDYFLTRFPGKSAVLSQEPEVTNRNFVIQVCSNSSIIYSNGESFMLANPFMFTDTNTP